MKSLYIDTSNRALSVAVSDDVLLAEININVKRTHSETLMPVINEVLKLANVDKSELERIIVANGPGSYTGLRIGVTVAKTLAFSLDIPIYTVSSLLVLAASYRGVVAPMMDGRRGNCFSAIYDVDQNGYDVLEEPKLRTGKEYSDLVLKYGAVIVHNTLEAQSFEVDGVHTTPRISSLIGMDDDLLTKVDAHDVVPDYLRLTEAERNWKNNQS